MPLAGQRRVLVIGGSFAGLCVGRDLRNHFLVTIVDAKEFFEYTPGILRAYVKPAHFDALSFTVQPVIENSMGCKFIWGEVTDLNNRDKLCTIKPMFTDKAEKIDFDYCIICAGCNFGPFHKWGQSLWFPTIHAEARPEGDWPHIDERFIEGRRRHILEEYNDIKERNTGGENILVTGAGFIGVEWVTELQHFFPKLKLTIIDFLSLPLGPLPKKAAVYCKDYMEKHKITQHYNKSKPNPSKDSQEKIDAFWKDIGMEGGLKSENPKGKCDKEYVCIGVKASNFFMPMETRSKVGPGGGGWILMDRTLAVTNQDGCRWCTIPEDEIGGGWGLVYAVGDCNYGCIESKAIHNTMSQLWIIPPIAKISYPGEEEAYIAATNVWKMDERRFHDKKVDFWGKPMEPAEMHWPWGAGMFATSLGPDDACFVAGANWEKNSGQMCVWGQLCAVQKEFIEASKTNECRYGCIGMCIWHFVHHTPLHLWGGGPLMGYSPSWF